MGPLTYKEGDPLVISRVVRALNGVIRKLGSESLNCTLYIQETPPFRPLSSRIHVQ